MRGARLGVVLLFLAVPGPPAAAQQQPSIADRIQRQVEAIAVASGIEGRRAAIVDRIHEMGLESSLSWFDPPAAARIERRGANITAIVPHPASTIILLGAHYDRVDRGQGVIDNASGVAAVLELAEALLAEPLKNFGIVLAFFDLEEDGRLGSRAMVADSLRVPLPSILLNFDIFGYGDAIWVGAADPDAHLPRLIQQQGPVAALEVVVDSMYPSSDHVSFRPTRTEAYGISLLDAVDIHLLLARFRGGRPIPGNTPRIFTIMHTADDTLDRLDASAMSSGIRAVERALRDLDAGWEATDSGVAGPAGRAGGGSETARDL